MLMLLNFIFYLLAIPYVFNSQLFRTSVILFLII